MNWIKNFVRPRFPSVFREHDDTPDNLWEACKKCGEMIFHRDLENLQKVCPGCDHHMRIGATARFQALFDKGEYELLDLPDVAHDPLKFKDQKKYAERLKEARAKSGDKDAVKVAKGDLGGQPAIIAVQDFAFMGGSLGMAAGEAVVAFVVAPEADPAEDAIFETSAEDAIFRRFSRGRHFLDFSRGREFRNAEMRKCRNNKFDRNSKSEKTYAICICFFTFCCLDRICYFYVYIFAFPHF